jgi:hypothetical protein
MGPFGRPEGNTTHKVYYIVSLEITLWVAAILMCFPRENEWRFVVVLCNLYSFSITSNYNNHSIHSCGILDLTS